MDPLMLHAYKIHAMRQHKRQKFVSNVILYSLSALVCTLLCSSPLWYPSFCATFNVVFFLFLPKLSSFFFTSKVLFVVGNLIVIFLVGESKLNFASKSKASQYDNYSDICYHKYKCKSLETRVVTPKMATNLTTCTLESRDHKEKRVEMAKSEEIRMVEKVVKVEDLDEVDEEVNLLAQELNKLADDFIAKVNKQRRLEANFGGFSVTY